MDIPQVVRNKAREAGVEEWIQALPGLVQELSTEWGLTLGSPYDEGTEAYVVAVTAADGTEAVLKVGVPGRGPQVGREALVLELAAGQGCALLLRHDPAREALLLERLGPSMHNLGLPVTRRHELLCDTARALWRPVDPDLGLPTGAEKADLLIDFVVTEWERLDRPCTEAAVDHAVAAARSRAAAHDDERAVLVHGDVHEWNALATLDGSGFKLVDPDGLRAEPEYDLGILMREDPEELAAESDPRRRSRLLAHRSGLDEAAIWEWGVVERVSTGLVATGIDLQPVGAQMLALADDIARHHRPT